MQPAELVALLRADDALRDGVLRALAPEFVELLRADDALRDDVLRALRAHDRAGGDARDRAHVPRVALRSLQRGELQCELEAALLFADISGFTRLATQVGVEELKHHINTYFSSLLALVASAGGDVVKFAGDAVLILFPVGDGESASLEQAVRSAALCALQIEQRAGRYTVGEVTLRLHSGLGCGRVQGFHVASGDGKRAEYLIDGPVMAQIAAAEGEAATGETVASPEAWALLEAVAEGSPTPTGNTRLDRLREGAVTATVCREPDLALLPAAALRPYVHPAAARGLAELRDVVVLFVSVRGEPATGVAERGRQLQHVMEVGCEALQALGGMLRQLIVDDKGTVLIGSFGLVKQEDDCSLALQSAVQIVSQLDATVGVTLGPVFCGLVGAATRCEYSLMGPSVNLAARLMASKANPGVLCDGAVKERAASQYWGDFEELEPIQAKGYAEPVPVFRPLSQLARFELEEQDEFVGREAELAAIAAHEQGALVIEGEGGAGKSALLRRALRGRPVVGLRASASRRAELGLPWIALLPEHSTADEAALTAAARQLLQGGDGAVLVIEDAQWLDPLSWRIYEAVAPAVAVLTSREPLPSLKGATAVLELGPLSVAEVRQLTGLRGRDGEDLHRRTGGNAAFLAALLELGPGAELPTGSVRDAMLARVDRLSPAAQAVLKAAAVCGQADQFLLRLLAPCDAGAIAGALQECHAARLLHRADFVHELMRDAVYGLMLESQRSAYHAQLAQHMESHGSTEFTVIAEHWEGANEPVRAAAAWLAAARAAGELSLTRAIRAMAMRGQTALEGHLDSGAAKALHLQLEALELSSAITIGLHDRDGLQQALELYRDNPALAERHPEAVGAYLHLMALSVWLADDREPAIAAFAAVANQTGCVVDQLRALAFQSLLVDPNRSDYRGIIAASERALELGTPEVRQELVHKYGSDHSLQLLACGVGALATVGEVGRALELSARVLELSEASPNAFTRVFGYLGTGMHLLAAGLLDEAGRVWNLGVEWLLSLPEERTAGFQRYMAPAFRVLTLAFCEEPSRSLLLDKLCRGDLAFSASPSASQEDALLAQAPLMLEHNHPRGNLRGVSECAALLALGRHEDVVALATRVLEDPDLGFPTFRSGEARVRAYRAAANCALGRPFDADAAFAFAEFEAQGLVLPARYVARLIGRLEEVE